MFKRTEDIREIEADHQLDSLMAEYGISEEDAIYLTELQASADGGPTTDHEILSTLGIYPKYGTDEWWENCF